MMLKSVLIQRGRLIPRIDFTNTTRFHLWGGGEFYTQSFFVFRFCTFLKIFVCFRAHDDNSPIHMAAINGYTKCIRALLSVHANILDVKNKHGVREFLLDIWFMFPVSFCCETSHSLVSKVLITFSICLQDTALHIASRAGQAKVIELLLSLGAKITNNVEEKSFIDIAIENRQTSVAQTAVKHAR